MKIAMKGEKFHVCFTFSKDVEVGDNEYLSAHTYDGVYTYSCLKEIG